MKRITGGFFCALILLFLLPAVPMASVQAAETIQEEGQSGFDETLYAGAAVLMDADSGRVLYGKNEKDPMAMASTTKIMTCILVLEEGNLEDTLQVSSYAATMPKVKLYIKKGETYQVRDLLHSLMLESHNDSAVALAEYIGKKYLPEDLRNKDTSEYTVEESKMAVAAFAALMNRKAEEIGCENTCFITPNGLDATETITGQEGVTVQKEHHTTAEELAKIMSYCITKSEKKSEFLEITRRNSYGFSANGRSYSCNNHNAFLTMMAGALSGKTGFTNKAGYCYVGALERDGRTFVVALLACGWPNHKTYKWSDTSKLMQYGVDHYFFRDLTSQDIAFDETKLEPIPVKEGQTQILGDTAYAMIEITGRDGAENGSMDTAADPAVLRTKQGLLMRPEEEVKVECRMKQSLTAPVRAGTPVGNIYYVVDDTIYRQETIVVKQDIEKIDLYWCMRQVFGRFQIL